jgi:hypothetical protein
MWSSGAVEARSEEEAVDDVAVLGEHGVAVGWQGEFHPG